MRENGTKKSPNLPPKIGDNNVSEVGEKSSDKVINILP